MTFFVIAFVQSQLGEIDERKEWTPEQEDTSVQEPVENVKEEKTEDKSLLKRILKF